MAVWQMYMPPLQFDKLRTPQGKVAELRLELNSGGRKDKNYAVKKVALKRIVANMTMSNNDMVSLFPDIIACMHIPSLEIKKMYVERLSFHKRPKTNVDQVLFISGQLCSHTARGCRQGNSFLGRSPCPVRINI